MSSRVAFGQKCLLQESQDITGLFENMGFVEQLAASSKSQEGAYGNVTDSNKHCDKHAKCQVYLCDVVVSQRVYHD